MAHEKVHVICENLCLEEGMTKEQINAEFDKNKVYSTEEKKVGTWIDGKPIYRKVIDVGTLPNATIKNVPLGFNINSNLIIKYDIVTYNPTSNYEQVIPNGNKDNQLTVEFNGTNMIIGTASNRTAYTKTFAILEYVRTTD